MDAPTLPARRTAHQGLINLHMHVRRTADPVTVRPHHTGA